MALYMVLDCETIGDPLSLACFDPIEPDKRLRDPEKIAASIAERTAERLAELSLHPHTNQLVAIGFHLVGRGDPVCLLARTQMEEREMLSQFSEVYARLDSHQELRLVTFGGLHFDGPTLMARASMHEVSFPRIDCDKYRSLHAPLDLQWHLSYRGAIKAKSLRFYRKRFRIDVPDEHTGADIAQLVADENWQAIEAHCLADVATTHALANRERLLRL